MKIIHSGEFIVYFNVYKCCEVCGLLKWYLSLKLNRVFAQYYIPYIVVSFTEVEKSFLGVGIVREILSEGICVFCLELLKGYNVRTRLTHKC